MTTPERGPTFDLVAGWRLNRRKVMSMFGSATRRALNAANQIVDALSDTVDSTIDFAKDAAARSHDLEKALQVVCIERDRALALAGEATEAGRVWRDRALDSLLEAEIVGTLYDTAEDEVSETAFVFGVLLYEVADFLGAAPASSKREGYNEARGRLDVLAKALTERDRDTVDKFVAEHGYVVVGEADEPVGEE